MSYNHWQIDWQLSTGLTASAAGSARKWGGGRQSYIVRGFSIVSTSTKAKVTKPVFALRLATCGTTTVTGNEKGTITLASSSTKGLSYSRLVTPFKVKPDEEACIVVKTACTVAYPVKPILFIEPHWDSPVSLGTGVVRTVTA